MRRFRQELDRQASLPEASGHHSEEVPRPQEFELSFLGHLELLRAGPDALVPTERPGVVELQPRVLSGWIAELQCELGQDVCSLPACFRRVVLHSAFLHR